MFNLSFLNDVDNYDSRKIGKIDPSENGIGVSTCWTSDEGYETALLDKNGTHPVERYTDKKKAEAGHEEWVEFAKTGNGKTITKIGWSDMDMDEKIILERILC